MAKRRPALFRKFVEHPFPAMAWRHNVSVNTPFMSRMQAAIFPVSIFRSPILQQLSCHSNSAGILNRVVWGRWINVLPAVLSFRNQSCWKGHFAGNSSGLTAKSIAGLGGILAESCAGASPLRRLKNEAWSTGFGLAFFLKKTRVGAGQFIPISKPRLHGSFFMID